MRKTNKRFKDLTIEEKNNLLFEMQKRFGLRSFDEEDLRAFFSSYATITNFKPYKIKRSKR